MKRIDVTKTFLPPLDEYTSYLEKIWDSGQLTNQGRLLKKFENSITQELNLRGYFHFVGNGTIALQLALNANDLTEGEIITTPFSYVASVSSILWERCTPIFVDINTEDFCINADKIEAAITPNTKAILAVHVFGFPCDIDKISQIATKHKLKVIYDASHAVGAKYNDRSLLDYGDISTCSFHSTKLLHTIEGGGVIVKDKKISEKVELIKRFGHNGDDHRILGINGKASEFQAAMGLVNLEYFKSNINKRKNICDLYDNLLKDTVKIPVIRSGAVKNYAYYPIVFQNEASLLKVLAILNSDNVFPRRYFYPSLNTLPYIKHGQKCPLSEDISRRILCLPLYPELEDEDVERISNIIIDYVTAIK